MKAQVEPKHKRLGFREISLVYRDEAKGNNSGIVVFTTQMVCLACFNSCVNHIHTHMEAVRTHLSPECACLWEMSEQALEALARFCQSALAQSEEEEHTKKPT